VSAVLRLADAAVGGDSSAAAAAAAAADLAPASASSAEISYPDAWLGWDKAGHAAGCALVTLGVLVTVVHYRQLQQQQLQQASFKHALVLQSFAAGCALGLLKEIADWLQVGGGNGRISPMYTPLLAHAKHPLHAQASCYRMSVYRRQNVVVRQ
jgi:hypothetical protein